jgi:tetratricopeptide (TPR) repeat protein
MRFFRLNISPRTRRKLGRYWSRVSWYVGYPFYHVRNFFVAVGTMFAEWWRRRIVRYLLQGLPALLTAIGVILFGALVYAQDRNLLATDYQRQGYNSTLEARKKLTAGEDATAPLAMAEMCFQRLLVLQNKDMNLYMLAQVLDVKKQSDAVIDLLRTMAPSDKTRFGLAHVNMAELYLTLQIPPPAGTDVGHAAENQLKRAVASSKDPKDWAVARAHLRLSDLYKVWNMPQQAEEHLDEAAKAVPEWRALQAEWYQRTGRPEQAKLYAQMAAQVYRQKLESNLDSHVDRTSLADVLVIKGDFADAIETLRLGATLTQDNEPLRWGFIAKTSNVYVAWYLAKRDDPKMSMAEKFDLLQKALESNPNNPTVFPLLIGLSHQTGPEAQKARQAVVDRTLGDKPSWLALLYLGDDAWASNNVPDARHHWERAFELSEHAPRVANNLAWVVAHYPPGAGDPQRALVMIDAAIQQLGGKDVPPPFHGTRGHILALLGRHKEALPELEKSIPGNQNDESLFRQLADTCEKLDMKKLSEDYRHKADEIRRKRTGPVRRTLPGADAPSPESPKTPPASSPTGDAKPAAGSPGPDAPKSPMPAASPGGKAAPAGAPGKQ